MILTWGDTNRLKGRAWFLLELASERTLQMVVRRLGNSIPKLFENEAVEIFLPIEEKDLNVFDLKTGNYIFIRSTNENNLQKAKIVTGVVGILAENDSYKLSKAIKVEDSYVQELIKEAENKFYTRIQGIKIGSFVRILDGKTRDYCGVVKNIVNDRAIIQIELKVKILLVETPIYNLKNLSNVPNELRVYYYNPLLNDLRGIEGGMDLIKEDLKFRAPSQNTLDIEDKEPKKLPPSRQRTVTALVARLIFSGVQEPKEIGRRVLQAIKDEEIKAPKNLYIVYCIIKNSLMKYRFKNLENIKTYRDVIRTFGDNYKFSVKTLRNLDPTINIPLMTAEELKQKRKVRKKKK